MKHTILIIEDEEDLLELLEYHLQKAGYETLGFLSTRNVEQCLLEESIHSLSLWIETYPIPREVNL